MLSYCWQPLGGAQASFYPLPFAFPMEKHLLTFLMPLLSSYSPALYCQVYSCHNKGVAFFAFLC